MEGTIRFPYKSRGLGCTNATGTALVETVSLIDITHSKHQAAASFAADRMRFTTSYWYDSVDLDALEAVHGPEKLERLLFHIAAFEINKICSLRPRRLDWGRYAPLATPEFAAVWRAVFRNVWAQWRFENEDPDYDGPEFSVGKTAQGEPVFAVRDADAAPKLLSFFGGGKDSLVSAKLLEALPQGYDLLTYSSSIYGTAHNQHDMIDALIAFCKPRRRRRQWVYDDFLDSPVVALGDQIGVRTLTAAETPSSIFAALPYAVQHRYTHIALAHEKSADTGQVRWQATGEDVNHQWGKSAQAERLLNGYISTHLVSGLTYFSTLKPVYDVVIFNMLRRHLDALPFAHSCNVAKPWCRRCAKCVYVWLNYLAYLPESAVVPLFRENLFDTDENMGLMRQMLGLERHMPFECIGQMDETKLAFELCRRKGFSGKAIDMFVSEAGKPDYHALIDKYTDVELTDFGAPELLRAGIAAELLSGAKEAKEYLGGFFN